MKPRVNPTSVYPISFTIEAPQSVEHQGWLALRIELWPDRPHPEHLMEMEFAMSNPDRFAQFICYFGPQKKAVGLAEASIQYSETGTEILSAACLDGIYVASEFTSVGVAAKLVLAVSSWAKSMNCQELPFLTSRPTEDR